MVMRLPNKGHGTALVLTTEFKNREEAMSVRRLDADQPAEFAFSEENLGMGATQQQIAKFPEGRQWSAVLPLCGAPGTGGRMAAGACDPRGRRDARHALYPGV